jgi:hypothetical protein
LRCIYRIYKRKVSVLVRNVQGVAIPLVQEPASDPVIDPQTEWLDDVLGCLAEGVAACASRGNAGDVPDAVRIDRIARLEKIKATAAALQAAESVRFAQSQAEVQLAADVHPDKIGRGIADQLGLACKVSGFEAARRLGVARALWFDLPETYRLGFPGWGRGALQRAPAGMPMRPIPTDMSNEAGPNGRTVGSRSDRHRTR